MPEHNLINIYENINCKIPYKAIYFKDIKKFCYGVSSSNLKKRFKNLSSNDLKSPWLFFSIVTNDRSFDLYLDESKLMTWFYGIKYYLKKNEVDNKLISVGNFVLTRVKLKLMFLMKEHYIDKKGDDVYKNLVKNLSKGKFFLKF
jgi:hypothetical protein